MSETYRTQGGNTVKVAASSSQVHADLDDLRAVGTTLCTLGATLWARQASVLTILWNLPAAGDALSPSTALTCADDVVHLSLGDHSLGAHGTRAVLLGGLLALSAVTYEGAEGFAEAQVDQVRRAAAVGRLLIALGYGLTRLEATGDPATALTDVLDAFPGAAQGGPALLEILGSGLGYAALVKALGAMGDDDASHAGPVRVTEQVRSGSGQAAPARSVDAAASRIAELHGHGENAAHIQAQRVVGADGQGRWVVLVPGTQEFGDNKPNPADGTGNLQSLAGHPSAMSAAVATALTRAQQAEGVYGRGEPVMVVGHSQGGMVAANLGRDPQTAKRFNITKVATFGAPVGHMPPGVDELDVVNTRDIVPAASGTDTGTDDPLRTRVTIDDLRSMTNSDGKRAFAGAHDVKNYGEDYADAVSSAAPDSPIRRFDESTRPFFEGEARTHVYDAHREPAKGQVQ